jgi:hypothetical protein
MVSAIYLFHLWGFVLAYAAFRIFIRSQHQCLRLLDLFLLLGAVEALLICLQSIGVVPRLWGSLYDVYGTKTYSGTLGPNRVMPGISMVLLLVVAAGYWRNVRAVGAGRLGLALFSAGTGLLALGVSGSRTAWVVFATFCLLSFAIARRRQAGILALGVMVVVLLAWRPVEPDPGGRRRPGRHLEKGRRRPSVQSVADSVRRGVQQPLCLKSGRFAA